VLVFAASGNGGTGRSVTSANLAYQRALSGDHVAYLDFDFGSPAAAATVFDIPGAVRGAKKRGLHSCLEGGSTPPDGFDVWQWSEHPALRARPRHSGRLVLYPGDEGGDEDAVDRCADLLLRLNSEFDLTVVDLSAGRSYAVDMVLTATARPRMRHVPSRWLVFHRWTPRHVIAASGLVHGDHGLIGAGTERGHDAGALRASIRFVRTAVPRPGHLDRSPGPSSAQNSWIRSRDEALRRLAAQQLTGDDVVLGVVPFEPVLQWREQLITEEDVLSDRTADKDTLVALEELARRLTDDSYWGNR
jgi:hypothetical protein